MAVAVGTAIASVAGPIVFNAALSIGTNLLSGAVNSLFNRYATSAIETGCSGAGKELGKSFAGSIASPDSKVGGWLSGIAETTGGFFGKQVVGKMVAGQYAGPIADVATNLTMKGLSAGVNWAMSGKPAEAPATNQPYTNHEDFLAFQEWMAMRRQAEVRSAAANLSSAAAAA